jgi:glycosyl transferase family 25
MKGFYINLKHRVDRKEHFEKYKEKFDFLKEIERFDAVFYRKYAVGCCLSHIYCLEKCLNLNDDYYLIMEDDFYLFNDDYFNEFINEFETIKNDHDWDIITLTPRGRTIEKNVYQSFHKIIETQTATGYIIKHNFINKLLPIFKEGLLGLKRARNIREASRFCIDQIWKPLQLTNNWIYFHKIFAGQLPCYSDIERRQTDYNKRFLEQLNY